MNPSLNVAPKIQLLITAVENGNANKVSSSYSLKYP